MSTTDQIRRLWADACQKELVEYPKKGTLEYDRVKLVFKSMLESERFYQLSDHLKRWTVSCHRLALNPMYVFRGTPDHTTVMGVYRNLTPSDYNISPY